MRVHDRRASEAAEVNLHTLFSSTLRGGTVQLHVEAALSPGEFLRYPKRRRLSGPQNTYGRSRK